MNIPFIEVDSKKIIRVKSEHCTCNGCYFRIQLKSTIDSCAITGNIELLDKLESSGIADCVVDGTIDFIYVESDGV